MVQHRIMCKIDLRVLVAFVALFHLGQSQMFLFPYLDDYNSNYLGTNNVQKPLVCNTTIGESGMCMHSIECHAKGGTLNGRNNCPFSKSCCVFENKYCGEVSSERVSHFRNPQKQQGIDQICTYRVNPISQNVDQYRLDFVDFNLNSANNTCLDEYFFVRPPVPGISSLCGMNQGQHIYVHTRESLILSVRQTVNAGVWNIKVTQIEGVGKRGILSKPANEIINHELRAPDNCLQYYPASSGRIQSFGFNTSFHANQTYAICLKKLNRDTYRIISRFVQWPNNAAPSGTTGCLANMYLEFAVETTGNSVPQDGGRICYIPVGNTVNVWNPGPFVITVKAGILPMSATPANVNYGFSIDYFTI